MFWDNWTYERNGIAHCLTFFGNSFPHVEKTLRATADNLPDTHPPFEATLWTSKDGGYVATIYLPLETIKSIKGI